MLKSEFTVTENLILLSFSLLVLDNNEPVSRESTPILGHYVDKFYKVKEGEQILLGSLDQTDGYHIGINGHQSKLRHSHSMIPTENSNKKAPVWQPLSIDELISHSPPVSHQIYHYQVAYTFLFRQA